MIIRNCHKKYNLCRNDAAASPFGKGGHEVAGYVSNNHTLLNPKCFSIGNYFIETYPPAPLLRDAFRYGLKSELLDAPLPCVPKGEADASHIFHLLVVIADNH